MMRFGLEREPGTPALVVKKELMGVERLWMVWSGVHSTFILQYANKYKYDNENVLLKRNFCEQECYQLTRSVRPSVLSLPDLQLPRSPPSSG